MLNKYFFILLFGVFISAVSQLLLKSSALDYHKNFIFEYVNIKVIVAYILFFMAVGIDLYCLKFVPVSFIPVVETSSFMFIIILSRLFFNEIFTKKKIFGIILIVCGIIIFTV